MKKPQNLFLSKLKMGLEKILPKWTSFLPGGLGFNTQKYWERHLREANPEVKEELLRKSAKSTGIMFEIFRTVPTLTLLYMGGKELGLGYYAIATWGLDRMGYSGFVGM